MSKRNSTANIAADVYEQGSGGGGGIVNGVIAGEGVAVNSANPALPVVGLDGRIGPRAFPFSNLDYQYIKICEVESALFTDNFTLQFDLIISNQAGAVSVWGARFNGFIDGITTGACRFRVTGGYWPTQLLSNSISICQQWNAISGRREFYLQRANTYLDLGATIEVINGSCSVGFPVYWSIEAAVSGAPLWDGPDRTFIEWLDWPLKAGAGIGLAVVSEDGIQKTELSTQTPGPGLTGGVDTMHQSEVGAGIVEIPNSTSSAVLGSRFFNKAPFLLSQMMFYVWQLGTVTAWQVGVHDDSGTLLGESVLQVGWSAGEKLAPLQVPVTLPIGFFYASARVTGNGYRLMGRDASTTFGLALGAGRPAHVLDNLAAAPSMGNLSAAGSETQYRLWMAGY